MNQPKFELYKVEILFLIVWGPFESPFSSPGGPHTPVRRTLAQCKYICDEKRRSVLSVVG